MARSILAVVAGLCSILAVLLAADAVVPILIPGAFLGPEGGGAVGLLLLTVSYIAVATALGGYLTAHIAAHHPARHALALGALSLLLMIAAVPLVWMSAPGWYHAVSMALVIPAAWLGAHVEERRTGYGRRRRAAPGLYR